MKFILTFLVSLSAIKIYAQSEADKIIATYVTEEKNGHVQVYKSGDKYFGKLVWIDEPDALDENNPDKAKRSNKVMGMVILTNFVYKGEGKYEDGKLYDPDSGNTYSGRLTLQPNGDVKMRGYVGLPMFGRSSFWTRLKK